MEKTQQKIRVFLVDDHEVVLDGLQLLLKGSPDIEVIGTALSAEILLKQIKEYFQKGACLPMDVILMDINMAGIDGIEATAKVKAMFPDTKILMLSMRNKQVDINRAIKSGANGYVSKQKGKKDFITAIRKIYNGEFVVIVDPNRYDHFPELNHGPKIDLGVLTEREKQIICLITKDFTTSEIVHFLGLSPFTVESYRKTIISKLKVKNIAGIIRFAIDYNLCEHVNLPKSIH